MGKSGKIVRLEDLYNLPEGTIQRFQSGKSVLTIPGATVTSEESIKIPQGAADTIEATKTDTGGDGFHIGAANVKKKLLVIRVKTRTSSTSATAAQLSDAIFGTGGGKHNLASQYNACSFGKLTMSPLMSLNPRKGDPPLDAVGVYEVQVNTDSNPAEGLREVITDKLNEDWPGTNLPSVSWGELDGSVPFDHVMYCMPPDFQMGIACKYCCGYRLRSFWIPHLVMLTNSFALLLLDAFVDSWLSVYRYVRDIAFPQSRLEL